jgi:metacaspase-1
VKFLPPEAFLSRRDVAILGAKRSYRRASPPGRYASLLMAGCQDTEFSYDAYFNDRPNGAFTYVALRALKTLPATATYSRWHQLIRRSLPSSQYPQSPNLFGSRSMKAWKALK